MNRIALVSGGTRGIGEAISVSLKNAGYIVAASYRCNEDAAKIFRSKTGIKTYQWDCCNYEECLKGIKKVEADLGPIEILVNNAGITSDAPFHKMTRSQWKEVIDNNLNSIFNMTHPIWPGMQERKFGRVINISSINAQKGQYGQVNYAASKAGIFGISRSLAQEGAKHGITTNTVCPGYIETDMVMSLSAEIRESITAQIPAGRLGSPENVASCVVFLASDDASYLNGSTISPNGAQFFS